MNEQKCRGHMSAMHRAACPICNPNKTVPELNAAAGSHRPSKTVTSEAVLKTDTSVLIPLEQWNQIQRNFDKLNEGAWQSVEEFGVIIEALRKVCHSKSHGEAQNIASDALNAIRRQRPAHETAAPQAPIARVTISDDGMAVRTGLYAPGLPPGEHDLYCEPEATAPYLRAEETPETPVDEITAWCCRNCGDLHTLRLTSCDCGWTRARGLAEFGSAPNGTGDESWQE